MAMNKSWRDKIPNEILYGNLPLISSKIASRRLKLAGHCVRHPEEEASKLVLWQPKMGSAKVGRRAKTYIDVLLDDCNLETVDELRTAMVDREHWKRRSDSMRAKVRLK